MRLLNDVADTPIPLTAVRGVIVGKVPFLNVLYDIFLGPWGLLLIIVMLIFIFIDEIIHIILILSGRYDDPQEDINEIIERIQREDREKEESAGKE